MEEEQAQEEQDPEDEKAPGLEERLLDMYKNRGLGPGDPAAELLNAVHASLRRKVDSLEEDNWIYEAEKSKSD
ncbi:MAG: hypothetical protein Q9190_001228 [Brigantiaea leucoxantha]